MYNVCICDIKSVWNQVIETIVPTRKGSLLTLSDYREPTSI